MDVLHTFKNFGVTQDPQILPLINKIIQNPYILHNYEVDLISTLSHFEFKEAREASRLLLDIVTQENRFNTEFSLLRFVYEILQNDSANYLLEKYVKSLVNVKPLHSKDIYKPVVHLMLNNKGLIETLPENLWKGFDISDFHIYPETLKSVNNSLEISTIKNNYFLPGYLSNTNQFAWPKSPLTTDLRQKAFYGIFGSYYNLLTKKFEQI